MQDKISALIEERDELGAKISHLQDEIHFGCGKGDTEITTLLYLELGALQKQYQILDLKIAKQWE